MNERKKKFNVQIVSSLLMLFLIVIAIGVVVFKCKSVWPFGSNTIAWADMTHSLPMYSYWRDVLEVKDSAWFSWRYGMGLQTLGIVSQMGLFSPFNIILIFFDRESIYGAIGVLLIFKMACMASTMYLYLNIYNVKNYYRILGALGYAFGMSALVQYPISMTLDMAIVLPILMYSYHDMIYKKRCWKYIFSLTMVLMINLYMGVMLAFFIIISTFSKWVINYREKNWRILFTDLFISSLFAISFSAPMWISVLYNYLSSSRIEGEKTSGILKTYTNILATRNFNQDIWLCILSMSLFFAIILCKTNLVTYSYNRVKEKGLQFLLLLLSLGIPAIEILWHMGSHSGWAFRYSFIVQFSIIEFSMSLLEVPQNNINIFNNTNNSVRRKILSVIIVFTTIIGVLSYLKIVYANFDFSMIGKRTLGGVIILIILNCVILQLQNAGKKYFLVSIFLIEILVNCTIWIAPVWSDRQDDEQMTYIYDATNVSRELSKTGEKCAEWERTKDYYGSMASNYATIMNVNSVANWLHIVKPEQQETMRLLGYSVNYTRFLDNGGTVFSDLLINYKHTFSYDSVDSYAWVKDNSVSTVNWYNSRYDIPNIFTVSKDVHFSDEDNLFSYQNKIFKNLTNLESDLFKEISIENSKKYDDNKIEILINGKQELYFYVKEAIIELSVNGNSITIPNFLERDNKSYPNEFNNGIIDLGTFENENVVVEIRPISVTTISEEICIATMDYGILEKGINIMNADSMQSDIKVENGKVSITLKNAKGEYLFVPILNDPGWKCFVNGKKIDTYSILEGFVGIPIIDREMDVKLIFVPQGFDVGVMVFCVLNVCLVIISFIRKKWNKWIENLIFYFVKIGMVMFMIAMYLLPILSRLEYKIMIFS